MDYFSGEHLGGECLFFTGLSYSSTLHNLPLAASVPLRVWTEVEV